MVTTQSGAAGTQYVFASWSDGGAASHSITVTSSAATYTASFTTQYQLTMAASPAAAGTLTPASGGFYTAGALVAISAAPASGFSFVNWTGGSVTSAVSASTTVTLGAPTTLTANFQAVATPQVSSLACTLTSLGANSYTTCTVTLSQATPAGGTSVTLSNTNTTLTVPPSVTVTTGTTSATFNASTTTISTSGSATVTATVGSSASSVTITLSALVTPASVSCSPASLTGGATSLCTVTLGKPTSGLSVVMIASNNASLIVPSGLVITTGSSGNFTASAASTIASNQTATLAVTLNSVAAITSISLVAPATGDSAQLSQISCAPKSLASHSRGTCRLTLDSVDKSTTATIQLSSSSASLRLPETVVTRPGQSTVEFQVDAVGAGAQIVVAASLGPDTVRETLAVTSDPSTPIHVPGSRSVKPGTEVRFQVSPSDSAATLSTGALPAGASFDSSTGEFRWTPDATQLGAHNITFHATDAKGAERDASVAVQVDSGEPVVTGIVNAATRSRDRACGPGAIAAIEGRWLTDGTAASDPSGNSTELAGTKVWADGMPVPILSASSTELSILCPDSVAGSEIQLVVQTGQGAATPLRTVFRPAAPGIFALDGSGKGQGWIEAEGTGAAAVVRNYRVPGQPAIAGERLLIYATGIGNLTGVSVQFGANPALPAAVTAVPNHAGLYRIVVTMPDLDLQQDSLPLLVIGYGPEGTVSTNVVNIAVEGDFR